MKTVLITGATGFIARHLARVLGQQDDVRVVGTSRTGDAAEGFAAVYRGALMQSIEHVFDAEPVDAVVHGANHVGRGEYRINVEGTSLWLEEAEAHGVGLQLLLSSLSAEPNSGSDYGRAKYDLEQRFLSTGDIVMRLGLVVGDGGMFLRVRRSLETSPFVPLLDGGRSPVFVIGIDCLCHIIRDCIVSDGAAWRGRAWQVQQPAPYTLSEVMDSVRARFGYSCRFIPVPSLPIVWALSLVERLPLVRLPVTSTHVRGMRQSLNRSYTSDYADFGYPEETLDALVDKAAKASSTESSRRR